ncbi:MAG: helix-turn-helix transcriptional regulator [Ruminococcus sp.]|nr:helix-turn-helix transcriptional regulator [Ruminococcus sp.]
MISYEPFWLTLRISDETTYTLIHKHHISSSTLNRMRYNKAISTATLGRLCEILKCDVDDILQYEPDEQN